MKRFWLAFLFAAPLGACASADKAAEPVKDPYVVIKSDTTMPNPGSVSGFQVGKDKSLIIQGVNGRWYRAKLSQPCASALPWKENIAIDAQPENQMDKFSNVIVDGNSCPLRSFEEIQNPRAVAPPPG